LPPYPAEIREAFLLTSLPELVNGNGPLVRRGRFLDVDFLVGYGDRPYHVAVRRGRIESVDAGPILMRPWRFAIRASEAAWHEFWAPVSRPGYHDIFAMTKSGKAVVEGDLQPLMANLRYIKEVLAAPRGKTGEVRDGS
jgi:hypothetical protein